MGHSNKIAVQTTRISTLEKAIATILSDTLTRSNSRNVILHPGVKLYAIRYNAEGYPVLHFLHPYAKASENAIALPFELNSAEGFFNFAKMWLDSVKRPGFKHGGDGDAVSAFRVEYSEYSDDDTYFSVTACHTYYSK